MFEAVTHQKRLIFARQQQQPTFLALFCSLHFDFSDFFSQQQQTLKTTLLHSVISLYLSY